jgi:hypothetical protein
MESEFAQALESALHFRDAPFEQAALLAVGRPVPACVTVC